jgi:hypothetical protein
MGLRDSNELKGDENVKGLKRDLGALHAAFFAISTCLFSEDFRPQFEVAHTVQTKYVFKFADTVR